MRRETGTPKILDSDDYSRAPCLGADQKTRGLWVRDWIGGVRKEFSAHAQKIGSSHWTQFSEHAERIADFRCWTFPLVANFSADQKDISSLTESKINYCHNQMFLSGKQLPWFEIG